MNTVLIRRSGPDAKLHFEVPVPRPGADYEIELAVRLKPTCSATEWRDWVMQTAGAWQGEYERPESIMPEVRDTFE